MTYRNIYIFVLILFSGNLISQQCATPFDLNTWTMEGTPLAHWKVLSPTEVIDTTWLFPATFFVSHDEYINVVIKGKVTVTKDNDNDFIGLVFGYKEPTVLSENNTYDFYLFDWKAEDDKKESDNITEGCRLSYYNGYFPRSYQQFYFVENTDNPPTRDLLDFKFSTELGWEPYREYELELKFTTNLIRIKIDSIIVFEREGFYQKGKFGFYCMSQAYALFKDFTYEQSISFSVSENSACKNEEIDFYSYDPYSGNPPDFIDSLTWNFGDGNTSNLLQPSHSYENEGLYDITLIVYKNDFCIDTLTDKIRIHPNPVVDLGDDIEIPVCSMVSLNASVHDANYLWSTGQHSESIDIINIPADTTVWVEVVKNGCTGSDTINIYVEGAELNQIYFPNAFTPNNDGINEVFSPVGNTSMANSYKLQIYNRWGQKIFESQNPDIGWDGTYNGTLSENDIYVYIVSYRMENCIIFADHTHQSTVMLIR